MSELSNHAASTSAYSNITFNATIYSGFYLLSNNYPGLLLTLGFRRDDFELLPTASVKYGVGVQFLPTVAYANSASTVTYKINSNFPNLNADTKYYTINSSGTLTTPDMIDLSYPRYLYLSIEGINSTNQANLPDYSFKNMFAKLPINCNFGE